MCDVSRKRCCGVGTSLLINASAMRTHISYSSSNIVETSMWKQLVRAGDMSWMTKLCTLPGTNLWWACRTQIVSDEADIEKTYNASKLMQNTRSEINKQKREATCLSLLSKLSNVTIFDRVFTSDTIRITVHRRKIMLIISWTSRQVVHYSLVPAGQTITTDLYSQQLDLLQQTPKQKLSEWLIAKSYCSFVKILAFI